MPLIALTIRVLNRLPQPYLAAELLRSVLHHHGIAVGPAASPVTTGAGVDGTAAPHCPPSATWCVGADKGEKCSSQEVCVRVIKSVAAASVDEERDAAAALAQPFAEPSSRAGSEGCDAAGTTAAGSATSTGASYFTLEAVRARPHISFCEILWQWERFVECGHACAVEQPDSHLCSSELALLNLKLEDSLLSSVAGLRGVRPALSELPPHLANVICSDLWADGDTSSRGCWAPHALDGVSTEGRTPTGPTCYTLTHFSAELGDVAYVEALQRAYPTGMPLRWFPQPVHSSGSLAANPVPGDGDAGEQDSSFRFAAPRAPRTALFYPLQWIAEHCPDHTGRHLCHLAACYGHVAYLSYLVQQLGAQAVLTERRCAVPAAPQIAWGRERYLPGLTTVQCAMAYHQLPVLLWVEERHSFALEEMNSRAVLRTLTAAAIAKADLTSTLTSFSPTPCRRLTLCTPVSPHAAPLARPVGRRQGRPRVGCRCLSSKKPASCASSSPRLRRATSACSRGSIRFSARLTCGRCATSTERRCCTTARAVGTRRLWPRSCGL